MVGYGLDFRERYRNLPDILQVDDLEALKADPAVLASAVLADRLSGRRRRSADARLDPSTGCPTLGPAVTLGRR